MVSFLQNLDSESDLARLVVSYFKKPRGALSTSYSLMTSATISLYILRFNFVLQLLSKALGNHVQHVGVGSVSLIRRFCRTW